ncbi:MAG: class I SAM-dependent methyltransferase [Terriglobales bacterium]
MAETPAPEVSLTTAVRHWWRENTARDGFFPTLKRFVSMLWEFVRESTPARRRQRYGDVEYDWDFRVDTTGATVGWRDRLLGHFHSPYQPTEPALFREMIESLILASPKIDFREFTFIDIGSGKGRALLMAADYPFRRVLGIELLPALHRVAQENIKKYKSDSQQCSAINCVLGDASEFAFPPEPTVLYLFNPLPGSGLAKLVSNLVHSLEEHPRPVFVLYHNPLLEPLLARSTAFKRIAGTPQYSIFSRNVAAAHRGVPSPPDLLE